MPSSRLYSDRERERTLEIPIPDDVDIEEYRTSFRRDYARLLHSPAFRRLQGKTQLFPTLESDFFRNRLTHSLEVAQIAKAIGLRLNHRHKFFKRPENKVDLDLLEFAGLAHDLGHPPFGHNGEQALDDCMKGYGGFEGNAQTLRILAKLEKREKAAEIGGAFSVQRDPRVGLNLTYRTLASILKYDRPIPLRRKKGADLVKGYYRSEASLVRKIKSRVLGGAPQGNSFKTIECQIMDFADDIAYSTYDLEDSLKAGFLTPLNMISAKGELIQKISAKVSKALGIRFTSGRVVQVLLDIFIQQGIADIESLDELLSNSDFSKDVSGEKVAAVVASIAAIVYKSSTRLGTDGHVRSKLTSDLVGDFIRAIEVTSVNERTPALSKVGMRRPSRERVEVLKHFTFEALIMSPRVKVAEYRGYEIVRTIFESLCSNDRKGHLLLPDDFRVLYEKSKDMATKRRTICDFIAGMTDQYAIEFYARLTSESSHTIFKPL